MRQVTAAWESAGIIEHEKKRVDGAPSGEVQGAMFEGKGFGVGLSREKRLHLAEAGMFLMRCRRVHVQSIARWTGKAGFCHYSRPAMRCLLSDVYTWIDTHRHANKFRANLWPSVRREMGHVCLLLAFAQTDLSLPFCPRLEASDASPGGHGRAYTFVDRKLIGEMARLCAGKGVHTSLNLEFWPEPRRGRQVPFATNQFRRVCVQVDGDLKARRLPAYQS